MHGQHCVWLATPPAAMGGEATTVWICIQHPSSSCCLVYNPRGAPLPQVSLAKPFDRSTLSALWTATCITITTNPSRVHVLEACWRHAGDLGGWTTMDPMPPPGRVRSGRLLQERYPLHPSQLQHARIVDGVPETVCNLICHDLEPALGQLFASCEIKARRCGRRSYPPTTNKHSETVVVHTMYADRPAGRQVRCDTQVPEEGFGHYKTAYHICLITLPCGA